MAFWRSREEEDDDTPAPVVVAVVKPQWVVKKVDGKVTIEGDLLLAIRDLTEIVENMAKINGKASVPAPVVAPAASVGPNPPALPAPTGTSASSLSPERKAELKAKAKDLLNTRHEATAPKLPL